LFWKPAALNFDGQISDHQRLRDVLEAKGYPVLFREYNGGHDYLNWCGTFGDNLRALIGKPSKEWKGVGSHNRQ